MISLRSFYYFLGSVYFAIILIGATAVFVIAGTLIESATQSHQYAALFTYDTPLFAALLWGFFINIFVSAVRRWPFRRKHIPFLTTHLGLLMILAGVLIKHYLGVQGTMVLLEGTASQEIITANTYAIQVDQKGIKKPLRYPLKKNLRGNYISEIAQEASGISIHLMEFSPHCSQCLTSWIKGPYVTIRGLDPLPLYTMGEKKAILPQNRLVRFSPDSVPWEVYALKTSDLEDAVDKLYASKQNHTPWLAIILETSDQSGKASTTEEEGDIHLIAAYQGHVWSESLPKGKLDSLISYEEGFSGYATSVEIPLFPDASQESLSSDQLVFFLRQTMAADAELPLPLQRLKDMCDKQKTDFPSAAAEFLLPLVRQYQASLKQETKQHVEKKPLYLETAVIPRHHLLSPGKKLEDNMPLVKLVVRKGKQAQTISLAYDKAGSGLKWPVLEGQYLLRFQPELKEIPYRLRLRQGRQINYPNSSQPYSYESDLIIKDQHSGNTVEKTISMNQVYETWDGYRFYLSGMAPGDETAVKQVHIVVNHDPAKYFLTYPGAFVLSCGILLLFILRPYRVK